MNARDWNRRYLAAPAHRLLEPNPLLVAAVADLPPGRGLDLGCGEGRNAVWLASRGWQMTVVDFSEVALERTAGLARARNIPLELLQRDLRRHSPPRGAFDLVAVLYVHLPPRPRRRLLRRAALALAPGGSLLVLGYHPDHRFEGSPGPPQVSRLFSPEEIIRHLPGLTVLRAERIRHRAVTEAGLTPAVETLVLLARPLPAHGPSVRGPLVPSSGDGVESGWCHEERRQLADDQQGRG